MNQDEKELELTVSEPEQTKETEEPETEEPENEDVVVTYTGGKHHHHHHHHHKHHSQLYYKYRNAKHQVKKLFRKKSIRFTFAFLLPIIALAVVVVVVLNTFNTVNIEPSTNASSNSAKQSDVSVAFDEVPSPQLLVNQVLQNYMTESNPDLLWNQIRETGYTIVQKSIAVKFSYQTNRLPLNTTVTDSYVQVSRNKDLSNAQQYNFDMMSNAYANFLETGTKYYYEINVVLSDGENLKSSGSFDTMLTPRLLTFDGPVNTRDIGGWTTESGKRIKEGMLIRGSELDGANVSNYKLSEQDFVSMHRYLGIVYDCDLRSTAENKTNVSALGANIGYRLYNIFAYTDTFEKDGMASVKALFSDLAKPENYPMYMHCAYGKDRTGTACAILEALLGVSKQDIVKDYQLSGLAFPGLERAGIDSDFGKFISRFEEFPGKSYQEKATNYLISCGVTEKEIESIKSIFLDN